MLQNLYLYPIPPFIESVRSSTGTTKAPRLIATRHSGKLTSLNCATTITYSFRFRFIHNITSTSLVVLHLMPILSPIQGLGI